jgi:putative endonuclease
VQTASPSPSPPSPPDAPREDPRRALGRLGEQLAAAHLERLGFAILERNARTRYGEIDLIAFDGHTLVFAEVKTLRARRRWRLSADRSGETLASDRSRETRASGAGRFGDASRASVSPIGPRTDQRPPCGQQPLAWLRTSQRARVRRLAAAWLHRESRNRPTAHTIRFDGIGVIVDAADRLVCLDHIEGAW